MTAEQGSECSICKVPDQPALDDVDKTQVYDYVCALFGERERKA